MNKRRILVVDDNSVVINLLYSSLTAENWDVLVATDGVEALRIVGIEPIDLVVLDIMMPNMDGFEVCRQLREYGEYKHIAIIMLTGRGNIEDKVRCLNLGADDYLIKPFAVDELIARVKSVLRRTQRTSDMFGQSSFTVGNAHVDLATRQITVAGIEYRLTPTEYTLLNELISNKGKILTHSYLLSTVWGPEYGQEKEYLRVFIGHLRSKLELDTAKPRYIITIPGVGYQFVDKT